MTKSRKLHKRFCVFIEKAVVLSEEETEALLEGSTKITITNQENILITVYLYNTLQPESPIQEMDIEPFENGTFSNLSAKYLYAVGSPLVQLFENAVLGL